MPKVSKDTAAQGGEYGPVTDRSDILQAAKPAQGAASRVAICGDR